MFSWIAALSVMMLSGCSANDSPSLNDVPADAEYAAMLDLKAAGPFSDTISMLSAIAPDDMAPLLNDIAPTIDLSTVMVYKPRQTKMGIVALKLTEPDKFTETLTRSGWNKRRLNDEEIYEPDGGGEFAKCIVVDRGAAWYLSTRTDLKAWRESLKKAEELSFASEYRVEQLVNERSALLTFINPVAIGMSDSSYRLLCVTTTPKPQPGTITLKCSMIEFSNKNGTGETVPLDLLAPITEEALATVRPMLTGSPSLTILAGLPQGIDWGGLVEMAGTGLDTRNQGMLQSLLPYMKDLKGLFALNVGPLTPRQLEADELEQQSLLVYGQLDGNRAQEAVEEINGNIRQKGLNPVPRADGVYAFTLGDARYRYTARNGAFIFALNREIDLDGQEAVTGNMFTPGKHLAASLTLPKINEAPEVGISLIMDADTLTITLKSTSGNPLIALENFFTALHTATNARSEAAPDYYDDYD